MRVVDLISQTKIDKYIKSDIFAFVSCEDKGVIKTVIFQY